MLTTRTVVFLAALSLLIASPVRASSSYWSCYGPLASILKTRDFPGADCRRASIRIGFLGTVRQGADEYLVYQYGYQDDPSKIGGVQAHALKRILIFKNTTSDYLGEYAMDAGFEAEVQGNRIVVRGSEPDDHGVIEIGPAGPPRKTFYGGDVVLFDSWRPAPNSAATAGQLVQQFYDSYGPDSADPSPDALVPPWIAALGGRPSLFGRRLTDLLLADWAAQSKCSGEVVGLDYDPFLQAQDTGGKFKVTGSMKSGSGYRVVVSVDGSPRVLVDVAGQRGHWQLVDFADREGHRVTKVLAGLRKAGQACPKG
jgi:hypothetical protein